jgi:hypothetical protein
MNDKPVRSSKTQKSPIRWLWVEQVVLILKFMTDRAPTQTIPLGRVDEGLFILFEKKLKKKNTCMSML